jgi:hypothetical protein
LATGHYEVVEQDLRYRLGDSYAKQVPRLHDTRSGDPGNCIDLWTESIYKLRVNEAELMRVPDIQAQNPYLVDERFATVPSTQALTRDARLASQVRLLPWVLSSSKGAPIYVPSVPKLCDAISDQYSYRTTDPENKRPRSGDRPKYHLQNLIRYLYLELPSQRETLLPLLAERNKAEMDKLITNYKRKPSNADIFQALGVR